MWLAAPTHALTLPPGLEALCEGDCAVEGEVLDRGDGTPFDFELALVAVASGLDLAIETGGSAYLAGPLDALGTIELQAGEIRIGDEIVGDASIEVPPPGEITILVPGIEIVAPEPSRTIGGTGVTLVTSGGGIRVAASTPIELAASDRTISIAREGDVYLDLAGVQLGSLSVTAGVSIVSREERLAFVPEPSTALFVGIGLVALAAHRRDRPSRP
jgi:hypothetical protein